MNILTSSPTSAPYPAAMVSVNHCLNREPKKNGGAVDTSHTERFLLWRRVTYGWSMGAHANLEVHRLSFARKMLEHSYGCLRTASLSHTQEGFFIQGFLKLSINPFSKKWLWFALTAPAFVEAIAVVVFAFALVVVVVAGAAMLVPRESTIAASLSSCSTAAAETTTAVGSAAVAATEAATVTVAALCSQWKNCTAQACLATRNDEEERKEKGKGLCLQNKWTGRDKDCKKKTANYIIITQNPNVRTPSAIVWHVYIYGLRTMRVCLHTNASQQFVRRVQCSLFQ